MFRRSVNRSDQSVCDVSAASPRDRASGCGLWPGSVLGRTGSGIFEKYQRDQPRMAPEMSRIAVRVVTMRPQRSAKASAAASGFRVNGWPRIDGGGIGEGGG
jgi:hypothetical protein